MNVGKLGEFGLISRLSGIVGKCGDNIVRTVGDDTAVLRSSGDRFLLATCDVQIEGVHFRKETFSKEQIGRRAAAVNLSDIAY